MAQHLGALKTPKLLVAYAFDVLPPQTEEFLQKFEFAQCNARCASPAHRARTSYPSAGHEIEAAAKWARARLEEGKKRIGVVVPDLQQRRSEVVRVFSRVMQPGYNLPGAAKTRDAVQRFARPAALGLSPGGLRARRCSSSLSTRWNSTRRSHLIRSPFLGGADTELGRRASLDAKPAPRCRRDDLVAQADRRRRARAASCASTWSRCSRSPRPARDSPAEWARHFSALLEAAGFPGERALDSDEFQTRAKWHEMLGELSKLERIAWRLLFRAGLRLPAAPLRRPRCSSPSRPTRRSRCSACSSPPGLRFDCLWVSGLTDEAWPLAARPNPFIPIAAQKKAGIPQASAEASAALDKRLTDEWKRAAAEVVFSWPAKDKDKNLAPSPLITDIAVVPAQAGIPSDFPRYRDLLFAARKLETFRRRARRLAVPPGKVRGGTRVLADQAACPFRAFAKWRLSAEALEEPESGLDPRDRGKLLHALMREIWTAPEKSDFPARAIDDRGHLARRRRRGQGDGPRRPLRRARARAPGEARARMARHRAAAARRSRSRPSRRSASINVAGLKFESRIDRMDELRGVAAARAHRLQELAHALAEAMGRPAPRRSAAAALRGRRARGPRRGGVRQGAPGEMRFMGYSKAEHALPRSKVDRDWHEAARRRGSGTPTRSASPSPPARRRSIRRKA